MKDYKWLSEKNMMTVLSSIFSGWLEKEENTNKYHWGFYSRGSANILEINNNDFDTELIFECVDKVYADNKEDNFGVPIYLIFHVKPGELSNIPLVRLWLPYDLKIALNSHYIVTLCRSLMEHSPEKYSGTVFKNTYNLEDFNM